MPSTGSRAAATQLSWRSEPKKIVLAKSIGMHKTDRMRDIVKETLPHDGPQTLREQWPACDGRESRRPVNYDWPFRYMAAIHALHIVVCFLFASHSHSMSRDSMHELLDPLALRSKQPKRSIGISLCGARVWRVCAVDVRTTRNQGHAMQCMCVYAAYVGGSRMAGGTLAR